MQSTDERSKIDIGTQNRRSKFIQRTGQKLAVIAGRRNTSAAKSAVSFSLVPFGP
ncbi:MAG: hypothetical protein QGG19_23435 [Alphaproteobacteria bacterium]|jgi:hypothetical protein|nr:hypothetical protein [Alphaproteobacteria bacterium]MDP6254794.1 hypothetical protein [Alphaproteobacteria bacterium]MDP7227869.1 hypothetical protein [Alphaproteobacteria bacterium]MDP7461894.1 hypothetical protein [Alphaproteobacteria bacterium]HJM93218.1 hypothetical protein [Alphaproteobacteria bacterium]